MNDLQANVDISRIPSTPGCYLFKDKGGAVIYVGKAKDLKRRVSSYFQKKDHGPKTAALISHIADVGFIATRTEVEALILENNLIKRQQPKYNIDLKDAKQYAYIEITNEPFPRILTARRPSESGECFGPFVSGSERQDVIQTLIKTFRFRTCKRLPKRACLRYHIKLCDAPCIGRIDAETYKERLNRARSILGGDTSGVVRGLEAEMAKKSSDLAYEEALILRDRIHALRNLDLRQTMQRDKRYDEDIINYLIHDGKAYLLVFNVQKGILHNKHEFIFEVTEDFLEELLVQYYAESIPPKEVLVPIEVDVSVGDYLSKQRGSKVVVAVPKAGERKALLDLVRKNVELTFFGDTMKVASLQDRLGLNMVPQVIECFDISHLSGTATVASMVQFRDGRPDKGNYRRYKIRNVEGIDDFASIGEVVSRRYNRLTSENAALPDLVIIDGGAGQLASALSALEKAGVRLPIIAIAKRLEEVYLPVREAPLRLFPKDPALLFIREIRDEAHRFAIAYNRLLRSKKAEQ